MRYKTFDHSRHGLNQLHSQCKVIIEELLKLGSFRIRDVLLSRMPSVHDNTFVSRGSYLWGEWLQVKTSASHGNGVVIVDNNKKLWQYTSYLQ